MMKREKTWTFTRGELSVDVTMDMRAANSMKIRYLVVMIPATLVLFVLSLGFLPLIVIPIGVAIYVWGKILTFDQAILDRAEIRGNLKLDQLESERWRAHRALGA